MNTVLGIGGWLVAIITVVFGYLERRKAREESRIDKTLDYFDGGSQRRSIGISLLEGVWIRNERYHSILVPLVANQIIYLLLSTESRDAHNERNLVRLIKIVQSIPDLRTTYHCQKDDICEAIYRKYLGETKGIRVTKPTLELWAESFGFDVEVGMSSDCR